MAEQFDFECDDAGGTVAMITPRTDRARDWIFANVREGSLVGGCYLTGEPRPMLDIAMAMLRDGLTCMNGEIALSLC